MTAANLHFIFTVSPYIPRVFSENFAANYIDPTWPVNFAENDIDSLFPPPPVRHAPAEVTYASGGGLGGAGDMAMASPGYRGLPDTPHLSQNAACDLRDSVA